MRGNILVVYRTPSSATTDPNNATTGTVVFRIEADPASGTFLVNGESNDLIVLHGGDANLYQFDINTIDEPFWIKYENSASDSLHGASPKNILILSLQRLEISRLSLARYCRLMASLLE